MSKKGIGILVIVLLVIAGIWIASSSGEEQTPPQDNTDENGAELGEVQNHPDIRITNPQPGDTVSSPLTVRGEARGTWFFEANAGVSIEDNEGNVLAQSNVMAQGEWMTEDFVPFEGTISWSGDVPEVGYVVFSKDNPSGLPENAAEARIPVYFEGGSSAQSVSVYFVPDNFGADSVTCDAVIEVTRTISDTRGVARAALNELLEGPTQQEESGGYVTSIPDGVELQSIRIENGTAYADFSQELNQVGGSCLVTSIRAQIEETLLQFSTVDDVVISVDGNVDEALQP